MRATDGTSRTFPLRGVRLVAVSTLLTASTVFALAIGVFLVIRRLSGAMNAPLPVPQLIVTAIGLYLWAAVVRSLIASRLVVISITLSVLSLIAFGCSYPANRVVDWLVWLPAIGLIVWPLAATFLKMHQTRLDRPPVTEENSPPEKILQQLTRMRLAGGKDALRGTLMAEFQPGERQTTLYVGFCPPFELLPQVEVNSADDFEADIKLAQVLHNGAQLDIRLGEPAEESIAVTIELFATDGE